MVLYETVLGRVWSSRCSLISNFGLNVVFICTMFLVLPTLNFFLNYYFTFSNIVNPLGKEQLLLAS